MHIDNSCIIRANKKIVAAVFCVLIIPSIILATNSIFNAISEYRKSYEARMHAASASLSVELEGNLRAFANTLQALTFSPQLDTAGEVGGFQERTSDLVSELGERLILLGPPPEFQSLANSAVADPNDLPQTLADGLRATVEPALMQVFAAQRPQVTNLFRAPVGGRNRFALFVPVIRERQVSMALGISVAVETLEQWIYRRDLPAGSFAFVRDGENRIMATTLDAGRNLIGTMSPDWLGRAMQGQDHGLFRGVSLIGVDTIYAVHRIPGTPGWTVAVAQQAEPLRLQFWAALGAMPVTAVVVLSAIILAAWIAMRDVQRRAQRELSARERGRQEIMRLHGGLPAVIFLREVAPDLSCRVLYRGGDVSKVTGLSAAALANIEDLGSLAIDAEESASLRLVRAVMEHGEGTLEWPLERPGGAIAWMRTIARVLERRPDGSALVVGYMSDITEERRLAAQGASAAKMATLGEMATGLAHEINQPLAVISMAAENAARSLERKGAQGIGDARSRLDRIAQHVARARSIMDHLRIFGRSDEGPLIPIALMEAIEGAKLLVGNQLQLANITLKVDLQSDLPLVRARLVPVEQVLVNLLINARDALQDAGTAGATIELTAETTDDAVVLRVRDNGPGIPPGIMGRLFEPFFTTKEVGKGTGLGLPICYGIMKGLGGSIEAHNHLEGGAEFRLRFLIATS